MRALPPRTQHGSVPLVGRLSPSQRRWWLCVGLGSRGVVYHAWLGRIVAGAVLAGSEEGVPPELLAWRGVAAGSAEYDAP